MSVIYQKTFTDGVTPADWTPRNHSALLMYGAATGAEDGIPAAWIYDGGSWTQLYSDVIAVVPGETYTVQYETWSGPAASPQYNGAIHVKSALAVDGNGDVVNGGNLPYLPSNTAEVWRSVSFDFVAPAGGQISLAYHTSGDQYAGLRNLTLTGPAVGAAPVAAFHADATVPTVGDTVQFTDDSTGSPTAWSWTRNGVEFSTEESPSLLFDAVGTYTIALTVTNASGSDTLTKTDYIVVSEPAAVPTVSEPTDRGNCDEALSSVSDNGDGSYDVRIVPRKQNNVNTGDRWWYFLGKITQATDVAHVIIAYDVDGNGTQDGKDNPNNRRYLGHKACFTSDNPDDPDATWTYFATDSMDGFDRVYPASFAQDTVYVAYHPVVTEAQIAARVAAAVASGHVTEPPSSVAASGLPAYVIGETSATVNEAGKAIPALPIYSFQIGSGSDRIALITGQHPGEDHGDLTFWAVVEGLLADTPEAAYLRGRFTICCYPNVNPTGRYGGHHRSVYPLDIYYDPNRDWTARSGYGVSTVYDAIVTDKTGHNLRLFCDFHGSNIADSYIIAPSTDGTTPDVPGVASFLTAMQGYYPSLDFVDSNIYTTSDSAFDIEDGFSGMRANFELETVDTNADQAAESGGLGAAFVAALYDRAQAGDYGTDIFATLSAVEAESASATLASIFDVARGVLSASEATSVAALLSSSPPAIAANLAASEAASATALLSSLPIVVRGLLSAVETESAAALLSSGSSAIAVELTASEAASASAALSSISAVARGLLTAVEAESIAALLSSSPPSVAVELAASEATSVAVALSSIPTVARGLLAAVEAVSVAGPAASLPTVARAVLAASEACAVVASLSARGVIPPLPEGLRPFVSVYVAAYQALAVPGIYQPESGAPVSLPVRVIENGIADQRYGTHRQAVVKCLRRSDDPEVVYLETYPEEDAAFIVDGVEWTVRELLGSADGTNAFQWAVLCGTDRRATTMGAQ